MGYAFEGELCTNSAIGSNETTQRQMFWRLRESLTEAEALSVAPIFGHIRVGNLYLEATQSAGYIRQADADGVA